jgi:hypothetical protein
MLWRIASNTRDTKTKVDTLWNWWLLHVSKTQLARDDQAGNEAGFTAGGNH